MKYLFAYIEFTLTKSPAPHPLCKVREAAGVSFSVCVVSMQRRATSYSW